jgi:hypothetical protein
MNKKNEGKKKTTKNCWKFDELFLVFKPPSIFPP